MEYCDENVSCESEIKFVIFSSFPINKNLRFLGLELLREKKWVRILYEITGF